MKHGRHEKAEKVLSKIVALGGDGEDWLALGVTQLAQKKLDKAEATLRGAQNLLKDSPFPSLHLAKLFKEKGDRKAERESVERAIQIDNNSVDAWAYLDQLDQGAGRRGRGDRRRSRSSPTPRSTRKMRGAVHRAPGLLRDGRRETRDKAVGFAKKAVERAPERPARAPLPVGALRAGGARSTRS